MKFHAHILIPFLIVIAVGGLILYYYFYNNTSMNTPLYNTTQPIPERSNTSSSSSVSGADTSVQNSLQNFDTIDPDLWEYTAAAEATINQPGNGSGHEKIVYGIVQRPSTNGSESTVYYFATKSAVYLPPPADTGDLFVGIYKYNVSDNTWERMFKRQSSYDADNIQPGDIQTFHVLGFDNEQLVVQIMADDVMTKNPYDLWSVPFKEEQGPNGTYVKSSGLVTIDLEHPYAKRPPYQR